MRFGSLKQLLMGAVLLGTAAAIGCGARDRASLEPRLDVASVIDCGTEANVATDELASEQLVNQQINAGQHVAEKRPATNKRKAWDSVFPGRKTDKTLAEISADPFLDDLDKMIAAKPTTAIVEGKAPSAEEAFSNTLADAKRDAEALFGPANDPEETKVPRPHLDVRKSNPFGDGDLVASKDVVPTKQKPEGALENAVFGDSNTLSTDDDFDQFLQDSAKPFSEPKKSLARSDSSAFDPPASAGPSGSESDFEPLRAAVRVEPRVEPKSENPVAARFEPNANEPHDATTVSLSESEFSASVPRAEETLAETVEAEFFAEVEPTRLETPMPQQDASVVANAPVSLPDIPDVPDTAEPPALTVPQTSPERVEVDPFDDPMFDDAPVINTDPFANEPQLPEPALPQFRTANRQVVMQPQTIETSVPATTTAMAVTPSTAPVLAAEAMPAQKMVLVEPGQWTAWFLIAGLITVALLLFAPGKGR